MNAQTHPTLSTTAPATGWARLHRWGGAAALALLVYSLVTMVILVAIGGQPASAQEAFDLLQANRVTALLRLDVLSIFVMPLYYLLFLCLYHALKETDPALAALTTVLVFAGVTLFLATPSVFSWLALYERYAAAASPAEGTALLAAGEAILASDMWHSSGPIIGGILMQTGAVLVSWLMLGSRVFGKATAAVGLITHGLDLAHILVGFFLPTGGIILMAVAGPLYLLWFPLVGRDLFRLSRSQS
jgi:hypothetical protein